MPKYPSFFRADEEIEPSKKHSPSPNEWFGRDRTKFRSSPAFSEEDDGGGWRDFYQGHRRDPTDNELQNAEDQNQALKFKNANEDKRRLIFVLEQIADIFEENGHLDLAAECESICEEVEASSDENY